MLYRHYEFLLREFCKKFQPPVPKWVSNTFGFFCVVRPTGKQHTNRDRYLTQKLLPAASVHLSVYSFNIIAIPSFIHHYTHSPSPSFVHRAVIGTSLAYFKRYYLRNSVMDLHPKQMIVTCMYLACKVEEFNVSITQFVNNVKGTSRLDFSSFHR